jgi:predicted  nucleic acid-binding Zn-ribbon protein
MRQSDQAYRRRQMSEKNSVSDLLKRKFKPISDWKPAAQSSGKGYSLQAIFDEAIEEAKRRKGSLEKALEPLSEEAKNQIKEIAGLVEHAARKSSKEARSFLAKTLEGLAGKIKP